MSYNYLPTYLPTQLKMQLKVGFALFPTVVENWKKQFIPPSPPLPTIPHHPKLADNKPLWNQLDGGMIGYTVYCQLNFHVFVVMVLLLLLLRRRLPALIDKSTHLEERQGDKEWWGLSETNFLNLLLCSWQSCCLSFALQQCDNRFQKKMFVPISSPWRGKHTKLFCFSNPFFLSPNKWSVILLNISFLMVFYIHREEMEFEIKEWEWGNVTINYLKRNYFILYYFF